MVVVGSFGCWRACIEGETAVPGGVALDFDVEFIMRAVFGGRQHLREFDRAVVDVHDEHLDRTLDRSAEIKAEVVGDAVNQRQAFVIGLDAENLGAGGVHNNFNVGKGAFENAIAVGGR